MSNPLDIYAVYVGGVLALSGVAIGGLLTFLDHALERSHRRHAMLRAKYEEMAFLFAECLRWVPKLSACKTIEDTQALGLPSEARKMAILAMVYFPHLKVEAADFSNAIVEYHCFGLGCYCDMPITLGAMMAMNPNRDVQVAKLNEAKGRLDRAISKYAPKYTKA